MKPPEEEPGGGLGPILERFPEHADSIREFARQDPPFVEICADYRECVAALQRFREQGTGAVGMVEEYTELRVSLEHELLAGITRWREASRNPSPAGDG